MSSVADSEPTQHFVCTHGQARALIKAERRFIVGVCGCREERGGCDRSRMDVCLIFNPDFPSTARDRRRVSREDALALVDHADAKGLVTRPFRNHERPNELDGICFCCPECCYYFVHPEEPCDKGTLRETTRADECSDCGLCAEVCHFGARRMVDGRLVVERGKCAGCGLCVETCASGSITMISAAPTGR